MEFSIGGGDSGGPLITNDGFVIGVAAGGTAQMRWAKVETANADTHRMVIDSDGDGCTDIFDACGADSVDVRWNCNAIAEEAKRAVRAADPYDPRPCGETVMSSSYRSTALTVVREAEQVSAPLLQTVYWDVPSDVPRLAASSDDLDGLLWTRSIDPAQADDDDDELEILYQDLSNHYTAIAPREDAFDLFDFPCLRYAARLPPYPGCAGCGDLWLPYRFVYDGCWPDSGPGLPALTGFRDGVRSDLADYLPTSPPFRTS